MTRITHADVVRIVQAEYRFSPQPLIADRAIVDTFESARGLIRRVCTGRSLDQEALSLLIRRKTPPSYVGDTAVIAFMADVLDLSADHADAIARVGELKIEVDHLKGEIQEQKRLIGELRASLEIRVGRRSA